jgi:hypothetical protein
MPALDRTHLCLQHLAQCHHAMRAACWRAACDLAWAWRCCPVPAKVSGEFSCAAESGRGVPNRVGQGFHRTNESPTSSRSAARAVSVGRDPLIQVDQSSTALPSLCSFPRASMPHSSLLLRRSCRIPRLPTPPATLSRPIHTRPSAARSDPHPLTRSLRSPTWTLLHRVAATRHTHSYL